MTIYPFAPLSRTSASLSTGSKDGVNSSDLFNSARYNLNVSLIEILPLILALIFSMPSLVTVRIVPSTGFNTALYAVL